MRGRGAGGFRARKRVAYNRVRSTQLFRSASGRDEVCDSSQAWRPSTCSGSLVSSPSKPHRSWRGNHLLALLLPLLARRLLQVLHGHLLQLPLLGLRLPVGQLLLRSLVPDAAACTGGGEGEMQSQTAWAHAACTMCSGVGRNGPTLGCHSSKGALPSERRAMRKSTSRAAAHPAGRGTRQSCRSASACRRRAAGSRSRPCRRAGAAPGAACSPSGCL